MLSAIGKLSCVLARFFIDRFRNDNMLQTELPLCLNISRALIIYNIKQITVELKNRMPKVTVKQTEHIFGSERRDAKVNTFGQESKLISLSEQYSSLKY